MSSDHLSRRQFLTTAGAVVSLAVTASEGQACWRRLRACSPVPYCPPPPAPALRVRQNIVSLSEQQLDSLKRGVAAMKARPVSDPRSWGFQANIHGTNGPASNPLFNQCQHGTLLFLAWHRGYLIYFERILRQASGDPDLTLPYWDWTTAPTLPAPYRTPASPSNPLYDDTRLINNGAALPPQVVVSDLSTALNQVPFPPIGPVGFSRSLEGSPHGVVHVLVGGNMGRVPTSANDPIFWLHHCNIDRIWDRWLNLGGGRVNPSDAAFLDTAYSFADEDGNTVTAKVRDVLGSAQLGYRYDNVPNPLLVAGLILVETPRVAEAPPLIRAASTIKEDETPAAEGKPLGFKPETVKLHPAPKHVTALKAAAEAAGGDRQGKILLQIEGLSVSDVPNFTYAVYLNLPEGDVAPEQAQAHYVGTIDFFGKGPGGGHAHGDGDMTFTETYDVTAVVARLREADRWKPDALNVSLRPLTPIPPKGEEEGLRKRSKESAKRAKISYKRINLLVQP
jgi:tyrosinase